MKKPIYWSKKYLHQREDGNQSFLKYKDGYWMDFQLTELGEQEFEVAPSITFSKTKTSLQSPFCASFGGIHLGGELPANSVELVEQLNNYFLLNDIDYTTIILPPSHLYPMQFINEEIYLENSWKLSFQNINHFVDLSTWSEDCMSKGNRKKLRQARGAGLIFSEASSSEWSEAFEVVRKNRESLSTRVSMSGIELFTLLGNFPETYKCFVLKNTLKQIVATAFLVETSYENIYVYLWADVPESRNLSPIVFLMTELVSTFKGRYSFLDLGTSAIKGEVLAGLSKFKDNLGATRSHKLHVAWQSRITKT